MRKGRRGFSLVEVVCAMTVVTIISAVTIGLISSSNRVMSNSKLAVGAANEARNIIDCYTAAVIQARMVYIDDNNITETVEGTEFKKFFEYIEKFHNGIREVRQIIVIMMFKPAHTHSTTTENMSLSINRMRL